MAADGQYIDLTTQKERTLPRNFQDAFDYERRLPVGETVVMEGNEVEGDRLGEKK